MDIWFEMEKSKKGITDFLECNWYFHDFRIERIEYKPRKDIVEIFLKYDTMLEGVLLRFIFVHGMHIDTKKREYCSEWLSGSIVLLLDNHSIIWADDKWGDESKEHLDEIKENMTWVIAERVFWAITDAKGNPIEMPPNRQHQVWVTYGKKEEKIFELKPFTEDWNTILTTERTVQLSTCEEIKRGSKKFDY